MLPITTIVIHHPTSYNMHFALADLDGNDKRSKKELFS